MLRTKQQHGMRSLRFASFMGGTQKNIKIVNGAELDRFNTNAVTRLRTSLADEGNEREGKNAPPNWIAKARA